MSDTEMSDADPELSRWESSAAWRELLGGIMDLDAGFLTGPKAVGDDEQAVAEGYRAALTALGVALDYYLFAEPTNPTFVDVNTPFRRDLAWGGDNTDAYYCFTPIDPALSYRVWGTAGDSAYFSLTVYNEPSRGAWSDRIVGVLRDTDLAIADNGGFSFVVGPERPAGYDGAFIELTPDASVLFTRDYQVDPLNGRRAEWNIEPLEPAAPLRHGDAMTAERMRAALAWVRTLFAIVPLSLGNQSSGHNSPETMNVFAAPYQVPEFNYGWSAIDACYSFGNFELGPDQALVVTHTPPACRFWSIVIWNQFMAGHSIVDERSSINHGQAVPNSDGTVTVVIAGRRLDHPNAISTLDHAAGVAAFRWFLTDVVPDQPRVEIVSAADAPTAVT